MTRDVVVHPDARVLAEAAAARLLTHLVDVQSHRSPVHVALTGGTVGIATLAAVAASPVRDAVDWSGVHLWWGDERFLPDGDPDRNETQARAALIDALGDALPAQNVHAMAARSEEVPTPEVSAEAYATTLAEQGSPAFDVVLLGMGPDGHVASLFPGHEALTVTGRPTVAVHDSPKPPPERVSLTYDAIRGAREVWVVAAGTEKAQAVASALRGAPVDTTPAAGALGTERTLWLVDVAATQALGTPAALSTTAAAFPAPVQEAAGLWQRVDEYFSALVPEDLALVETRHAAATGGLPDIAVAPNQGKLLHLLAQAVGARRILEIGTLGGYSTLWLARALPSGGTLTTLEIDPEHARVAVDSLTQAGVDDHVDVLVGPAADTLDRLVSDGTEPFDLVFVDADKQSIPRYLEQLLELTRPGSVVVVDNVVRGGAVLDADHPDERVQGVRAMVDLLTDHPRYDATVLQTVGAKGYDGLALLRVRD
ncbi:6-phosphogluconolactonase [Cellulomonas fengjieae]|uniref:6-phosphogluconolactonase n=1 Tax=Cellulomonas fengjieae TaxID=2819978 RepID=UPI001AAE19F4|nr:6-phosphogluconolactonase [Cellulomonas fengjieae]MBO3102815.1 6-phosphogluconolactonase [Cellulomonas fengjieae]